MIPVHANSMSPKGGLVHGDMAGEGHQMNPFLIPYLEVIQRASRCMATKGGMHVTVDDHLTVSVSDVLREMGAKE